MISRFLLLLLALVSSALASGCEGGSKRSVNNLLDLFPHATTGTEKTRQGRIKLMAETKTHRLVFVGANSEVRFEGLDLPRQARFEAEMVMLDMPTKSKLPLEIDVVTVDDDGDENHHQVQVRTQLEKGRRWIPISVYVESAQPIVELRVSFQRADFAKFSKGRLALLRPKLTYKSEIPDKAEHPARQIVLITTDTLRADVLGCYGNREVRTPRMDRLAGEGSLFEMAFTAANVTNPSHTSMFTSLYPKDHGVADNFTKLSSEVPTLLEPLRDNGFVSAAFVSSFNFQPEKSDFDKRFDEFFPCEIYFERRAEDVNLDAFPWLVEHANDDFFIWLHYFDVHMPYVPPFPYDGMYAERKEGKIDLPIDYKGNLNWFAGSKAAGHYRAKYHGEVTYLDDQLGLLFDQMQELDIYDQATIALVSDHGEALGEHGVYCDHASLFDEVTRVPFLIKEPGHMNAVGPRRIDALVSTVDLYPTFFELYNLKIPGLIRGQSLVPWMRGEEGPKVSEVYSSFARGIQESVRTTDLRYIEGIKSEALFPKFSVEAGSRELYRVDQQGLLTDITGDDPAATVRMAAVLAEFLAEELDYESVPIDDEFIETMGDLGYVQDDE